MLRRIASNPSLRHAGNNGLRQTALHATPVPAMPTRSLVSTVLMSRDAYEERRVQDLKTELKQRGLTTSGKRTDLIQRLVDNDAKNAKVLPTASAVASASSSSSSTANAKQSQVEAKGRRTQSTSAKSRAKSTAGVSASASSQASADKPPPPSTGYVGTPEGATVSHPPNMEPGQVSSMTGDIEQISTMEADTNAPGVPVDKQAHVPIVFDVKIPYEEPEPERGATVPVMKSYFHPEEKTFSGYTDHDGPVAHVPKVRTVSGEDTYPGGGVAHHHPIFEDHHVIGGPIQDNGSAATADSDHTLRSAFASVLSTMQKDLGLGGSGGSANAAKTAEAASRGTESTKSVLRDARDQLSNALRNSSSSGKSYSTSSVAYSSDGSNRPMSEQERRGLYVLGGIVAGGFLLGSLGNQSKRKQERIKQEIARYSHETEAQASKELVTDIELAGLVARAESVLRN